MADPAQAVIMKNRGLTPLGFLCRSEGSPCHDLIGSPWDFFHWRERADKIWLDYLPLRASGKEDDALRLGMEMREIPMYNYKKISEQHPEEARKYIGKFKKLCELFREVYPTIDEKLLVQWTGSEVCEEKPGVSGVPEVPKEQREELSKLERFDDNDLQTWATEVNRNYLSKARKNVTETVHYIKTTESETQKLQEVLNERGIKEFITQAKHALVEHTAKHFGIQFIAFAVQSPRNFYESETAKYMKGANKHETLETVKIADGILIQVCNSEGLEKWKAFKDKIKCGVLNHGDFCGTTVSPLKSSIEINPENDSPSFFDLCAKLNSLAQTSIDLDLETGTTETMSELLSGWIDQWWNGLGVGTINRSKELAKRVSFALQQLSSSSDTCLTYNVELDVLYKISNKSKGLGLRIIDSVFSNEIIKKDGSHYFEGRSSYCPARKESPLIPQYVQKMKELKKHAKTATFPSRYWEKTKALENKIYQELDTVLKSDERDGRICLRMNTRIKKFTGNFVVL